MPPVFSIICEICKKVDNEIMEYFKALRKWSESANKMECIWMEILYAQQQGILMENLCHHNQGQHHTKYLLFTKSFSQVLLDLFTTIKIVKSNLNVLGKEISKLSYHI